MCIRLGLSTVGQQVQKHRHLLGLPMTTHGGPEADDSGDADDDDGIVVVIVGTSIHQGLTGSQGQGQVLGCYQP